MVKMEAEPGAQRLHVGGLGTPAAGTVAWGGLPSEPPEGANLPTPGFGLPDSRTGRGYVSV